MTLLSPGVETKEINLQTTIARSSTGRAALVGKFNWGPAYQISQVVSEVDLVDKFGRPDDQTADSFFSGVNFLNYGNDLRLVRVLNETKSRNSSALYQSLSYTITSPGVDYKVGDVVNVLQGGNVIATGKVTVVNASGGIVAFYVPTAAIIDKAKSLNDYPALDNAWQIQFAAGGPGAGQAATATVVGINLDSTIFVPNDEYAMSAISERSETKRTFIDICEEMKVPAIVARYAGTYGDNIKVLMIAYKDYYKFNEAGKIVSVNTINPKVFPTGLDYGNVTPSSYLEFGPQNESQFAFIVFNNGVAVESKILSTKPGDRDIYGTSIYINEYFGNGYSSFVQGVAESWPVGYTGVLAFGGGQSSNTDISAAEFMKGWDMFADREHTDVNLFIAGAVAGEGAQIASTVQKAVVAIADERRDCLVLISPPREYMINQPAASVVRKLVDWRRGVNQAGISLDDNMNIGTTYASVDGNYKYQYDKYNDVNRWIPLAADIAGLCARTDTVGQPWQSPAGFNRGQIVNVIKLAVDTRQAHRDEMYTNGINPIVGFAGQGYILYGDKTASQAPTPFDRINVRRLFNLLKKSISESAKYKLFELNDAFTRSSFRSEVGSYLDTIRSLGGIYDFRVVCDESNNTPAVIDRNEFVATILIKPARSINYITLSFVATSTGADFDELVGSFQQ
ncbi:gp18 tail sheath protein [Aeromonas phage Aeh1]|uniref:Gp18 tail sheath protein n=1 Tax=Aeromonas phage Aeh1 TaxID=2880362 RepID=Q76YL7_9CAUD|nr:tail sheath [Aeromonas phage Aeh1]AAQ17879.1 gp18 tail sheath protein [Aeromonas phage Aeh1]